MIPERDDTPSRPLYHASVPSGWGNDPNGLCFFGGRLHMFYQYNPHDTVWGPMHWGHMVSGDLARWEDLPVALFPDRSFDSHLGCFSGSALVKGSRLYVIYTGVDAEGRQQQCMAYSDDGVSFTKYGEPVITSSMLPPGAPADDFRDPKLFARGEIFYCLVGTRIGDAGNIALYRSGDLREFSFVGMLFGEEGCGIPMEGICECPDIHRLGDEDILIFSPQHTHTGDGRFQNPQSTVYMTGRLDCLTGRFSASGWDVVDHGSDFYAAQAADAPDGRCLMIAWKEMWGRTMPTASEGWAGSYTIPRELSLREGTLIQTPARELKEYFAKILSVYGVRLPAEGTAAVPGLRAYAARLVMTLMPQGSTRAGIRLFCRGEDHVSLYYDSEEGCVVLDRSSQGTQIKGSDSDTYVRRCPVSLRDGELDLDIFLDRGSIEVFINGGEKVMTMNAYPRSGDADG
ncbi:MAG: glycoside hydrolase family 32 protein, partial [Eubacteriaceae bacterium]|nr:glycoside hydrolase family 32 protein [Eubacteriaceae bacterium]